MLGYSRWTLVVGSFLLGAATWWLHGIVVPAHRMLILPGALFWPWMIPACAACMLWGKTKPAPPRSLAIGYVVMAVMLALSGGIVSYAIQSLAARQ